MASTPKEIILKKIRQALSNPTPIPFPETEGNDHLYQPQLEEPEIEFAENFTKLLGVFSYCMDEAELVAQLQLLVKQKQWNRIFCREDRLLDMLTEKGFYPEWHEYLNSCQASITTCEALIARTGSMVLSSTQQSGRTTSVYAPVHICIAYTDQLVYDIKDGLQVIKEKYGGKIPSFISFATGPSRTADIEKTLVVGIHGPKEVYVFLVQR